MLRLLAAVICLGLGSPALAALPDDPAPLSRDATRADPLREEPPREDAAEIWLRESAPSR